MNPKKQNSETSESKPKGLDLKLDSGVLRGIFEGISSTMMGFRIEGALDRLTAAILTSAYVPQPWYLPGEVLEFFKGFLKGISPTPEEGDTD